MKKSRAILIAALLLSGAIAALVGFPPGADAVEFTPVPAPVQINSNLKQSLDISASDDGRIYTAWSEKVDGNMDIYFSYTSNNGTTFSPSARVNRESEGSQKNSRLATANGSLYIVWEDGFSDAGDIMLARSENGGINFEEVRVSDHEEGTQANPAIAASGNRVAVAWEEFRSDNTIRVWNGDDGTLKMEISGHQGAVRAVDFSPNGSYMASASEDSTVKIWNAATGALVRDLPHHSREVTTVNWSPDGKLLATGSFDHEVILLNSTTFGINSTLSTSNGVPTKNYVNRVSFSPDSALIAVAYNGAYGTGSPTGDPTQYFNLTVWDHSDSKWTRTEATPEPNRGHTKPVLDVAFSHNGTYVASGGKDNRLKIWQSATGDRFRDVNMLRPVHSVSWSPDDRFVAVGLGNGSVAIINISDVSQRAWMKSTHTGRVNSLDWSVVRKEMATGASDPLAKIWHNMTGPDNRTVRKNLAGHINSVHSVSWSPDGQLLATASGNTVQYGLKENQIFCAVSDDGGRTFSSPVMVADSCAGYRLRPKVAVGPSGTVSVVWYDFRSGGDRIYFANSTDGKIFGSNIGIDLLSPECTTPQIFVDASGTAHLVWQHESGVKYANSRDNFAASLNMMDANAQMPSVTGSPDGSSLWVAWRSKNTTDNSYHIKVAVSYDSGATFNWEPAPIASHTSLINQYAISADMYNGTYVVWDIAGNVYHRTTVLSDEWPPSVQSTYPRDGDIEISVFTSMVIRFSEPMKAEMVESVFSWTDGTTTWRIGNCTDNKGKWNGYGDMVSFQPKPKDRPRYGTDYSFSITTAATDLAGNNLTKNLTVRFKTSLDVDPPIIEHKQEINSINYNQEYTVDATVIDQWGTVDSVRLYYQGVGQAAPSASLEMSHVGNDTYRATIPAQQSLGKVYYYIWASDVLGNKGWSPANITNQSNLYNVSVVDRIKPEISHVPVIEADVFREMEVWAVVTDAIQLQSVWLNYRPIGSVVYTRVAMPSTMVSPNTFSFSIPAQDNIGMIHYNITAIDSSGNFNTTPFHSVQILDRTAPLINSVTPELLDNQTRVRVRAVVTDDVSVGSVTLYFKAVGGKQWVERTMVHVSGDVYEFTIPAQRRSGIIHYYVNATDTSGNRASTLLDQDQFEIEVIGIGPNYTLYYILGGVLAALMVLLFFLLSKRLRRPEEAEGNEPEKEAVEEPMVVMPEEPREEKPPEQKEPEKVDEAA